VKSVPVPGGYNDDIAESIPSAPKPVRQVITVTAASN
jgi:hypothetical protein